MWSIVLVLVACDAPSAEVRRSVLELAAPQPADRPEPVVAVAAGEGTTCLVVEGGDARCVGAHAVDLGRVSGPLQVSDAEICTDDRGARRCWREGQPVVVEPSPFVEVVHGAGPPCGREAAGAVWCWADPRPSEEPELVTVPLPAPAVRVVGDGHRACALLEGGALYCWQPEEAIGGSVAPLQVAADVRQVEATWMQTCWRTGDGVWCRADGDARRIADLGGASDIAVGRLHACALEDGVVKCWGNNSWAQLASPVPRGAPWVAVPAAHGATDLAAGDDHTCALLAEGRVHCWGRNDHGQVTGVEHGG